MYDPLLSPFGHVKQRYKLSVWADFGQIFNWLLCVNHSWYMENLHTVKIYRHSLNPEPILSPFGLVKEEIQVLRRSSFWPNL
jgi:hypothetical protein